MKKTTQIFLSLLALAAIAGCQREIAPQEEAYVDAVFAAALPDGVKAAGDGSLATRLDFYVFDADGVPIPALTQKDREDFRIEVSLLRGQAYQFLFLAHAAEGSMISVEGQTLAVDYSRVAEAEEADAFYAWETCTVDRPFVRTVTLKRPFAQVNVAASAEDVAIAVSLGVSLDDMTATLTLSGVGDHFDCATGTVSGHSDAVFTGTPGGLLTVDGVDYTRLVTAYVLPSADALADFRAEAGAVRIARHFSDFNLATNFQTNFVGHILTVGGNLCTE